MHGIEVDRAAYLPIIDAHVHLFDGSNGVYSYTDFARDAATVDRVHRAVYVECLSGYAAGDPALAPVGETRFAIAAAEALRRARGPGIAAIISYADLFLGDRIEPVLEAHIEAGGKLFKGVRYSTTWDSDPAIPKSHVGAHPEALDSLEVRTALGHLARLSLAWDAWVYHNHLPNVQRVARTRPDLTVVLNHLGGPLGANAYRDSHASTTQWMQNIADLARLPNVYLKVGGLALPALGFISTRRGTDSDVSAILRNWHDRLRYCIDQFGPSRCMFESNFPVDKRGFSYSDLWEAFGQVAEHYSPAERSELFSGAAIAAYSLPPDVLL